MTRRWGLLALAAFLSTTAVAPVACSSHDHMLRERAPGGHRRPEEAVAAASSSASETKSSASSSATSPPAGVNTIVILLSTEGGSVASSTSTMSLNGSSLASGSHSGSASTSSGAFTSSVSGSSDASSSSTSSQVTMTVTPTITVGPGGATNAAAAASASPDSSKVAGMSPGGLAGLIVGIVLGLVLLGIAAYFIWKWVSDSSDRREWAAYQNLGPDSGAYMMGGARRPPSEYADSIASGRGGGFDSRRQTTDWRHSRPAMTFTGASRPGSYANSDFGGYQRNSYRSERSERWHKGEY